MRYNLNKMDSIPNKRFKSDDKNYCEVIEKREKDVVKVSYEITI